MFSKKHIALFVSILLGVSTLAGCGAKDSADVTEAEVTEDTVTEAAEEAATETETSVVTDEAAEQDNNENDTDNSTADFKTVQYIVVEPSQENIRNAVLELDPTYDTEKLDAFLKAQYDEENSEDVPWVLSKVQCAVKDDTSGNVYIINYTQTGTLLKICNMTDDSVFTANLAPELLSITITSDDTATYLNVASDRGNLIGGYVFDLTNEKVLVDTYARDTEEGVTDEQVYPEEYLKYANLDTLAFLFMAERADITENEMISEKYSAQWASYLTEDYIKELSAAVWENTTNNMDSTVNNADTYFSDVNMDGVPEFIVSCEGVEHDSLVQIFTITDTGVSLLYETTRFYGVYDIDGITSCCGIKPNYDTDSWDVVNLCNNDIVFTAAYESDSDLWDSYESYITKDTAVREYLSGYTQLNSVSETVPLDFRGIGMDTENVLSEYLNAILEK